MKQIQVGSVHWCITTHWRLNNARMRTWQPKNGNNSNNSNNSSNSNNSNNSSNDRKNDTLVQPVILFQLIIHLNS